MTEFQSQLEIGVRLYRQFCEAYKTQNESAEPADPTQPYALEYATREKFKQIRSELEIAREASRNTGQLSLWTYKFRPETFDILILAVDLQLGLNHSNTEELAEAKQLFRSIVERIESENLRAASDAPESYERRLWVVLTSGLLLSTYIQMGQVSTCFGEYSDAVAFFRKAESVYANYEMVNGVRMERPPPYRSLDLFDEFRDAIAGVLDEVEARGRANENSDQTSQTTSQNDANSSSKSDKEKQRTIQFESNYVAALLNLARTYAKFEAPPSETGADNSTLAATYCQLTLSKQLEISHRFGIAYDRLEWAVNAATLSQFYCSTLKFRTAKYLLDCADSQLQMGLSVLPANVDEEKRENASKVEADIARCWVKFCLSILERSWVALRSTNPDSISISESAAESAFCSEEAAAIRFECDVELETKVRSNNDLEVRLLRTFDEAKRVFSFANGKLQLAERTFTIDERCTQYCECVQDRSSLLRSLANYADDSMKSKLYKRRTKLIRPVLCEHQLSSTHYLVLYRELTFELADIYGTLSEFARLKLERVTSTKGSGIDKVAKKINTNAKCAIYFFTQFIRSYEAPQPLIGASTQRDGEKRWNVTDNEWRSFLVAHVRVAQLHSKLVSGDMRDRIESTRKALDTYRLVLSFADANPRARAAIPEEYEVCSEMVGLLPARLDKMVSAANN